MPSGINHNAIKWNKLHSSDSNDCGFHQSASYLMGSDGKFAAHERLGLSSLRTLQTFPRQISHANFVKIVNRMYYYTFYKSTFSSPSLFSFLCDKRLHCRYKFVLWCCCFVCCCCVCVCGGGGGGVLSWYFLKQIKRLPFCSCCNNCLAVGKSARIVTHVGYKDDALVLVMRSQKHGSLGMCTIPIVNTNNETQNQNLWVLLADSSGLYFILCFKHLSSSSNEGIPPCDTSFASLFDFCRSQFSHASSKLNTRMV